MKKLGILFASVFLLGLVFQSCNNGKTYAEMREKLSSDLLKKKISM